VTESPADTIRRAAALMRQRAQAATTSSSGRWYVRTAQGGYPQSIGDNASAVCVADVHEGPQHPQAIAPFIASMDPTLALAIADWLDSWASDDLTEETISDYYADDWRHALKIARAYLAEPDPTGANR
jgi:hypothetical protein